MQKNWFSCVQLFWVDLFSSLHVSWIRLIPKIVFVKVEIEWDVGPNGLKMAYVLLVVDQF